MLFNLMLRGNNNMVRFSGQGDKRKHNMPYGERNRFDIDRMLQHHHLSKDFNLSTMSFTLFLNRVIKNLDLSRVVVYIDSPYSNTTATYNENGGWTSQEDEILLNKVLKLRELGAKVVISNVFHNRGKTNQWLIDWSEEHNDKFDVHYLDRDYSNSASFKSDKKTVEVLLVSK
ncbi:putative adenine methyltransferase [Vibrio phage RYC]|nr:putative adenine methyltransferase [Vibrio phage RYC]